MELSKGNENILCHYVYVCIVAGFGKASLILLGTLREIYISRLEFLTSSFLAELGKYHFEAFNSIYVTLTFKH